MYRVISAYGICSANELLLFALTECVRSTSTETSACPGIPISFYFDIGFFVLFLLSIISSPFNVYFLILLLPTISTYNNTELAYVFNDLTNYSTASLPILLYLSSNSFKLRLADIAGAILRNPSLEMLLFDKFSLSNFTHD